MDPLHRQQRPLTTEPSPSSLELSFLIVSLHLLIFLLHLDESLFPVLVLPLKVPVRAGHWWHMLLIPALRRQRQVDLCEFEAKLVYKN